MVNLKKNIIKKEDVISDVAIETLYTQKNIKEIVEAFLENVMLSLSEGNSVVLRGFGTFELKKRKKRTGRNINTGESVDIPERYAVVFKPGAKFKRLIDELNTA